MEEATTARFVHAARVLSAETRQQRLKAPGFRSPPRLRGAARSLRRWDTGSVQVAVQVKGRPWLVVLSDMIEGVVAANQLRASAADSLREALWAAAVEAGVAPGVQTQYANRVA